jgi:hypothetical protein
LLVVSFLRLLLIGWFFFIEYGLNFTGMEKFHILSHS